MKKILGILLLIFLFTGCQNYDRINNYDYDEKTKLLDQSNDLYLTSVEFDFHGLQNNREEYVLKETVIIVDENGKISYLDSSNTAFFNNSRNVLHQGHKKGSNGKYLVNSYIKSESGERTMNKSGLHNSDIRIFKNTDDVEFNMIEFDNTKLEENNTYITWMIEKTDKNGNSYYQNNNFVNNGLLDKGKLKEANVKNLIMIGFSIVEDGVNCGC